MSMSNNADLKLFLDEKFGSDVKNLQYLDQLYPQTLNKKTELSNQLKVMQTEVPSKIKSALVSVNKALDNVEDLELAKTSVHSEVEECIKSGAFGADRFQQSIKKIESIHQFIAYIKWVIKIEETSGGVQQFILSDSMDDACESFRELIGYLKTMNGKNSKCHNLIKFLQNTIMFWYKILKDKLSKELDDIMKLIGWPFVLAPGPQTITNITSCQDKTSPGSFVAQEPSAQLDHVFANLLKIHLPFSISTNETNIGSKNVEQNQISIEEKMSCNQDLESHGTEKDVILLPFQLLLRPLKQRFRFHFSGNKQTNNPNKPEWYLTQVITWINHHAGFLEHTIQPILDKNNYAYVDALMMFSQGLLNLVTSKLSVDISETMYDDELFTHTVDEILLFDKELRTSYDLSESFLKSHGPLTILAKPDCIRKWLNVERSCAVDRLDTFLSSSEAWISHFPNSDTDEIDEMKTPQCAESFITMLLTITERYKNLPSYEDQLQFLDLQLLLLDDFRIRLTQVIRSLTVGQFDDVSLAILNAALFVTTVLKEWADNVFFLELKYYKDKETSNLIINPIMPESLLHLGESKNSTVSSSETTDETVFASTVNLYERIYSEGLVNIAQDILAEFKIKSRPYLHDQWIALPPLEDQIILVVSRSACPMLEVLQQRLYTLEQKLCRTLFTKLWRYIAEKVDQYLYEEVVLKNHFNAGGSSQLEYDMTRNLFPLFGAFTSKPENYFRRMKEAVKLLNLTTGNALLLKDAFADDNRPVDPYDKSVPKTKPSSILNELGITLLQVSDVIRLLNRRIDSNCS